MAIQTACGYLLRLDRPLFFVGYTGWPSDPEPIPAAESTKPLFGGKLTFMGSGLDASNIRAIVEKCGKGAAAAGGVAKQLRTVASVTSSERAAIAERHKFDDLPEGCCFDGSRYRDEFGDMLREHPLMNR